MSSLLRPTIETPWLLALNLRPRCPAGPRATILFASPGYRGLAACGRYPVDYDRALNALVPQPCTYCHIDVLRRLMNIYAPSRKLHRNPPKHSGSLSAQEAISSHGWVCRAEEVARLRFLEPIDNDQTDLTFYKDRSDGAIKAGLTTNQIGFKLVDPVVLCMPRPTTFRSGTVIRKL